MSSNTLFRKKKILNRKLSKIDSYDINDLNMLEFYAENQPFFKDLYHREWGNPYRIVLFNSPKGIVQIEKEECSIGSRFSSDYVVSLLEDGEFIHVCNIEMSKQYIEKTLKNDVKNNLKKIYELINDKLNENFGIRCEYEQ